MNQYSYEMWNLLYDATEVHSDKIVCPVTGGLDSRVIAYILSLKNVEIISYYIYTEDTRQNFPHIDKILKECNVKFHHWIYAKENRRQAAIDYMSERYNLNEYDFYIPAYNNIVTGGNRSKKRDRAWWYNKKLETPYASRNYRKVINPTNNPKWIAYCYSLPYFQRFLQRAYINMVNDFTPLGDIPRCFEHGIAPIPMQNFAEYAAKFLTKKIREVYGQI